MALALILISHVRGFENAFSALMIWAILFSMLMTYRIYTWRDVFKAVLSKVEMDDE